MFENESNQFEIDESFFLEILKKEENWVHWGKLIHIIFLYILLAYFYAGVLLKELKNFLFFLPIFDGVLRLFLSTTILVNTEFGDIFKLIFEYSCVSCGR